MGARAGPPRALSVLETALLRTARRDRALDGIGLRTHRAARQERGSAAARWRALALGGLGRRARALGDPGAVRLGWDGAGPDHERVGRCREGRVVLVVLVSACEPWRSS